MTEADRARFGRCLRQLSVLSGTLDEDAPEAYWAALQPLAIEDLEASVPELLRESQWIPKPVEWRAAAEAHQRAALERALPPGRPTPWRHECEACEDTGWVRHECPATWCGRPTCKGRETPHDYVTRCVCRATNRTYQRHHQPVNGKTRRTEAA